MRAKDFETWFRLTLVTICTPLQFYNECYIIEKKDDSSETIQVGRLILAEATAKVMEAAFKILGIKTLHKM